ncbi:MAG: hypothetical protein KDC27_10655 [Acidobacteria bacterium]|nr:hypothetical protein [Acidobacteriota bacterium]
MSDKSKSGSLLWWALPPLLLYAVYWKGLFVWFHGDDFTLIEHVRAPAEHFWALLFEPRAQGTYRTLSERLFFYWFYQWFGLNGFPFRVMAFGTQVVNLWLFGALLRRTGLTQAAALAASCLWAIHHGLSGTMSWSSSYNQALFSLFLLVSLLSFQAFLRSGNVGYYLLQWVTFLAGFLALETIVIYPALALGYALAFERKRWAWALPMFLGSALIAWVQLQATPPGAGGGAYHMSLNPLHWIGALRFYCELAFAGSSSAWAAWLIAVPLAAFAGWKGLQGEAAALFGWFWFLVGLTPYLPLGEHLSDYYLFLPSAGLAIAGGLALVAAWRAGWGARAAAAALLAIFLVGSLRYSESIVDYSYRTSIRCRNLVTGLRYARVRHPDKTILLTSMDEVFFYASIYHDLFKLAGVWDVYLAPDANSVSQRPDRANIDRFFLAPDDALRATLRHDVAVYDASGMRLRGATSLYEAYAPGRLATMLETE